MTNDTAYCLGPSMVVLVKILYTVNVFMKYMNL